MPHRGGNIGAMGHELTKYKPSSPRSYDVFRYDSDMFWFDS